MDTALLSMMHSGRRNKDWAEMMVNLETRNQKVGFNTITDTPITTGVMKVFKFGFLFCSDKYFHGMKG